MEETSGSSSLGKRLLALVILAIASWILLKWVIGLIMGLATVIVIIAAVIGVIWAVRTL